MMDTARNLPKITQCCKVRNQECLADKILVCFKNLFRSANYKSKLEKKKKYILRVVSCSIGTVQKSSSLVVEKTCRTNEDKHTFCTIQLAYVNWQAPFKQMSIRWQERLLYWSKTNNTWMLCSLNSKHPLPHGPTGWANCTSCCFNLYLNFHCVQAVLWLVG